MPVQACWDDQQHTVVRLHFTGHWTWEELSEAGVNVAAMMQSCPVRVDAISDMLDTRYLPPRYVETMQMLFVQFPRFPHLRLLVLAGAHRSYASLFELARDSASPSLDVAYASNLDAARALIAHSRRGDAPLAGYGHWAAGS
jgi:hypothetical protein